MRELTIYREGAEYVAALDAPACMAFGATVAEAVDNLAADLNEGHRRLRDLADLGRLHPRLAKEWGIAP